MQQDGREPATAMAAGVPALKEGRLGYDPASRRWDELVDADGAVRPHWQAFFGGLEGLPPQEIQRRWDYGRRLIRENGVTYNVYGDPRGLDRPWQLDPVPMIIPAAEWRGIEAAMIQRANLLRRVLADIYGPQHLLAEGLLPAALVYAHPGYLRPLRHVQPPGGTHLHLYSADLARGADGRWQVVSDRAEAPSGAGYALENRLIVARMLGEMMREETVEPLLPFFTKLRETLAGLSPRERDASRSVLLTPGPYNETYFEHAYLARQLGYTLVEGEDLTMRDGRVYLKTLDGLQPIDVILRRTDGSYCDPLELRGDSTLGIAGLVQAVRGGSVLVANALGSGVIEGSAMAAFLPALCRRLLGEELKMPSAPTLWCGAESSRRRVVEHLAKMVIKPALPGRGTGEPVFGDSLSAAARRQLAESIQSRPQDYLAQERLRLSAAPVWTGGRLEPRPVMMRVYLAAHDGSYVMMPGALTRVAGDRDGDVVSMQKGGGSKDTWVLAEPRETPAVTVRSFAPPVKLVRGSRDLPSRVADNLFWLGRYVERAEDTTRLVRAVLSRAGNQAGFGDSEELPVLLNMVGSSFNLPEEAPAEAQALALARQNFDPAQSCGLRNIVDRIHRMASLVRDRLSQDTWRAVNVLQQEMPHRAGGQSLQLEDALAALNAAVLACEALSGLAMENMTRGLSWRFMDIGRRLERAVHVVDILSGICPQEGGTAGPALDVLLAISDSTMTYRSRYLATPQFAAVLDLLLADESNPRSLAFQTSALSGHMDHLASLRRTTGFYGAEQRLTIWLTGALRTADIEVLARPDADEGQRLLGTFLEVLRSKLWELSETVTRDYFTHAVSRSSAATATLLREFP